MKSKVIIAAMSAAILLAGAAVFAVKTSTTSLLRSNVEALASQQTPVKQCFLIGYGTGEMKSALFCNRQTSTEMIYKCENESINFASGSSLCTR